MGHTDRGSSEEIGNPWRFQGRRFDQETGFLYFRLRYLDPGQGRFVNRDPIGVWGDAGNLGNGYSFCGNDPVNRVDPWGLDAPPLEGHEDDPGGWDTTNPNWEYLREDFVKEWDLFELYEEAELWSIDLDPNLEIWEKEHLKGEVTTRYHQDFHFLLRDYSLYNSYLTFRVGDPRRGDWDFRGWPRDKTAPPIDDGGGLGLSPPDTSTWGEPDPFRPDEDLNGNGRPDSMDDELRVLRLGRKKLLDALDHEAEGMQQGADLMILGGEGAIAVAGGVAVRGVVIVGGRVMSWIRMWRLRKLIRIQPRSGPCPSPTPVPAPAPAPAPPVPTPPAPVPRVRVPGA